MRVAVLVDQFPELSETFVAAEARALRDLGARIRIEAAAPAAHPDPDAAAGLDVRVYGAPSRVEQLRALAWLGRRAPRACVRDLRARRRWRREEWPRPLRQLAPLARRVDAAGDEHLHAHFGAGAALDALRVARLLGLPHSVTFHGHDIFRTPRNIVEKLTTATFATSGSAFTVAHLRVLAPAARVHVVVMGVDPALWRRSRPPAARPLVLAVGRLVEKKGFTHLVRAAGELDAETWIVGDGPLRSALQAQAGARVRFLGPLPSARVRALLEEASVVAVPCVVAADGDTDSMPVIAKEALAMEVPVVASDVAGLPEVVQAPWGATVPPGDAAALARALRAVLDRTPAERAVMGAAGRTFVTAECSLAGEAAKLLALIEAVKGRK